MGSLRKTLLKYIFGEGRIQSRASEISVATYYLAFINSTFEFYELRKKIVESSISEIEKNEIYSHLESASNTWPLLAKEKIRELSEILTPETSSSQEQMELTLSRLPPKLRGYGTSTINIDICSFENFNRDVFAHCK